MQDIKLSSKKEEVVDPPEATSHGIESSIENIVSHSRQEEAVTQGKKNKYRRIRKIVASFMGLAMLFFVTTMYSQYQVYVLKKKTNASTFAQLEASALKDPKKVMEAVSRHMMLPTTTPQVAMVEDSVKLQASQPFFKDVLNGDVVLMYKTTIIVYRPSRDVIVSVGDIR